MSIALILLLGSQAQIDDYNAVEATYRSDGDYYMIYYVVEQTRYDAEPNFACMDLEVLTPKYVPYGGYKEWGLAHGDVSRSVIVWDRTCNSSNGLTPYKVRLKDPGVGVVVDNNGFQIGTFIKVIDHFEAMEYEISTPELEPEPMRPVWSLSD